MRFQKEPSPCAGLLVKLERLLYKGPPRLHFDLQHYTQCEFQKFPLFSTSRALKFPNPRFFCSFCERLVTAHMSKVTIRTLAKSINSYDFPKVAQGCTKMSEISVNTVENIDEVEQKSFLNTCTTKLHRYYRVTLHLLYFH